MEKQLDYFVDPEDWEIQQDGEGVQCYRNLHNDTITYDPPVRKHILRMKKLKKKVDAHRSSIDAINAFKRAGSDENSPNKLKVSSAMNKFKNQENGGGGEVEGNDDKLMMEEEDAGDPDIMDKTI